MTGLKLPIVSLIIYSNKAKFIDVSNRPSHVMVIKHADVFEELDKLTIALSPIMAEDDIKRVATKIKSFKSSKDGVKLHKRITTGKAGKQ